MKRLSGFCLLLAMTGLSPALGSCSMSDAKTGCFSRYAPSLPLPAKVRANLNNGETGRRIHDAVVAGDMQVVEELIRADPQLLQTHAVLPEGEVAYDGNSGDLLSFAIAQCNPQMVGLLLELGADPDGQTPGEPLTLALLADDLTMAEMLLQGGATPDAHGPLNLRPMMEVLQFRNLDALALLIRHRADVNAADEFGGTALQSALLYGDYTAAEMLIRAGANPWQVGNQGKLPAATLARPVDDSPNEVIRRRLAEQAKRPGLPWPPPPREEVQTRFAAGQWPTQEMKAQGFVASDGAMRSMRQSVANRAAPGSSSVN